MCARVARQGGCEQNNSFPFAVPLFDMLNRVIIYKHALRFQTAGAGNKARAVFPEEKNADIGMMHIFLSDRIGGERRRGFGYQLRGRPFMFDDRDGRHGNIQKYQGASQGFGVFGDLCLFPMCAKPFQPVTASCIVVNALQRFVVGRGAEPCMRGIKRHRFEPLKPVRALLQIHKLHMRNFIDHFVDFAFNPGPCRTRFKERFEEFNRLHLFNAAVDRCSVYCRQSCGGNCHAKFMPRTRFFFDGLDGAPVFFMARI